MEKDTIKAINNLIFLETIIPEKADVIVVLGSNWENTMIDVKKLYDKGISKKIIITGGHYLKNKNTKSEAEIFRDKGIDLGIPKEGMILETFSTNTKENIVNIIDILKKEKFCFETGKILFVCKAFHTRRVFMTAKRYLGDKIDYYFYPIIDDRNISKKAWLNSEKSRKRVLSEIMRIGEYSIKGDLSIN